MKSKIRNYLLNKFKEGDVTISKTLNELSEEQIKVIHEEIDKVFTKEKEDLDNEQTGNNKRNDF